MARQTYDAYRDDHYSVGPKNERVRRLNRDRAYSKLRGYPSDKEYMKAVRGATQERNENKLSVDADRAQEALKKRRDGKKIASKKKGRTKQGGSGKRMSK